MFSHVVLLSCDKLDQLTTFDLSTHDLSTHDLSSCQLACVSDAYGEHEIDQG